MKMKTFLTAMMAITVLYPGNLAAQEEEQEESSPFSAGADFYSSFIWRGSKFGTGPAFQPGITYTAGGFTAGAWGSFDAAGYAETDLYLTYDFDFGLSLGITDYYFPDYSFFDVKDSIGSHAFEAMAGYSIIGFSLSANYVLNRADSAGSVGGDMYFEAGYDFRNVSLFVGAGNGWHTTDGEFMVCNIGLGTSRTIQITDRFSVTATGKIIFNPEQEKLFAVVGFTL